VQDGIEDFARHSADSVENSRRAQRLMKWIPAEARNIMDSNSDAWDSTMWEDVQVGDILKIRNREMVPADVVLLASSDKDGLCYVMTANLDGEANLKLRQVKAELLQTIPVQLAQEQSSSLVDMSVNCDLPNKYLEHFQGVYTIKDDKIPLAPGNILLRGTQLRNTEFVIGVAIYTGHESKIMQNNSKAPMKVSQVAIATNKETFVAFGTQLALCIMAAIYGTSAASTPAIAGSQFLSGVAATTVKDGAILFGSYFLIFTNYIPISLLVTLDMVKFLQARWIQYDIEMYHEMSNTPMLVRCSDLNEELGQVEHVFSDKTGTLTQNLMEFVCCSIAGQKYGVPGQDQNHGTRTSNVNFYDPSEALRSAAANPGHPDHLMIREFFVSLMFNHTVMPEQDAQGNLQYSASSPDEAALVNAARHFGFVFLKRQPTILAGLAPGDSDFKAEILNTLEFNSTRKRSSVILRVNGRIVLHCKGADNIIRVRLSKVSREGFLKQTDEQILEYSKIGLRTLFIAYREVSNEEYYSWLADYKAAETSLEGREDRMSECMDRIESDLVLLGATAIDDKLQDGVVEAISSLRAAGIKIWVLTGDKVDTAISISFSAALLTEEMQLHQLTAEACNLPCDDLGVPSKVRQFGAGIV
jgi:phospholipid-transporting ATPase